MPVSWRTTLTPRAIANCNISLRDSPFHLRSYTGGTNEGEAPEKRLTVQFMPRPTVEMWVYGDKKILTPRTAPVGEFFDANRITPSKPVELEITQPTPGTLIVRRA